MGGQPLVPWGDINPVSIHAQLAGERSQAITPRNTGAAPPGRVLSAVGALCPGDAPGSAPDDASTILSLSDPLRSPQASGRRGLFRRSRRPEAFEPRTGGCSTCDGVVSSVTRLGSGQAAEPAGWGRAAGRLSAGSRESRCKHQPDLYFLG